MERHATDAGIAGRIAARAEAVAALVSRVAVALAAVAVLACFVLVCWGVAARYFVDRPLVWGDEVTGWIVVAIVMLAVADAQRRGDNIGVDLLTDRARGRPRRALLAFGTLTVAVAALLMLVYGVEMVEFSHMLDLRSNTIGWFSVWTIQVFVPLGAGLLLLVALAQLVVLAAGRTPAGLEPTETHAQPKAGIE